MIGGELVTFGVSAGGRVVRVPEHSVAVELPMTDSAWRSEPLGDGRAMLRDARGEAWGIFANPAECERTAERLSR